MFVRSRMEKDVTYRRKGNVWVIKANSVTYIDENKVRAKELKSLYGSRIEIMSRDVLEEMEKEIPVNKEVVKKVERKNPVENVEKPLDNIMLNDILSEIKKEIKGETKEEKIDVKEDVIDPIKETLMGNVELTVVKPDAITEIPIQVTVGDEIKDKLEVQTVPLQVKKDEFGNIVLDPIEVQTAEMTEEQIKDKLEVQSSTVEEGKGIPTLKEEENKEENKKGKEEKDKESKTIKKVVAKKAVTGKRRGRKKATVK